MSILITSCNITKSFSLGFNDGFVNCIKSTLAANPNIIRGIVSSDIISSAILSSISFVIHDQGSPILESVSDLSSEAKVVGSLDCRASLSSNCSINASTAIDLNTFAKFINSFNSEFNDEFGNGSKSNISANANLVITSDPNETQTANTFPQDYHNSLGAAIGIVSLNPIYRQTRKRKHIEVEFVFGDAKYTKRKTKNENIEVSMNDVSLNRNIKEPKIKLSSFKKMNQSKISVAMEGERWIKL